MNRNAFCPPLRIADRQHQAETPATARFLCRSAALDAAVKVLALLPGGEIIWHA
jgi:hypothetical protein